MYHPYHEYDIYDVYHSGLAGSNIDAAAYNGSSSRVSESGIDAA